MDFVDMKRRDLQALCKKHNLLASGTNSDLVSRLTSALKKEEVEAKPVTRHVKKKGVSVGEESEKTVDLGKGLDGKKSKPTRNEAEKKSSVNQDVPVPTRATRSRGDVGEVVDIHSFPVEKKKKSVRGRVEDSSDGGVKEMAVRSTRSRGVVEEAAVLPNVEKTRSKKEGSAKNHSEVKEVTSVRTTRSRVGEEVSDINHSSPVVKKTTKGKEVSTKNEDGMQKVISVRTTRSRVGEEVSDINHSSPVVKKTTKGKEVSTKNEDGMKKEISVRTTRSRVAEEVTEINHSSPVVKKTAKGKGVRTENDDGVKNEISVRTTRSRVASGVVDGHASPPVEKKGKKRGRESSEKDEEVKQELSLRSTRSRTGADVAVSHFSPPADKKNAKRRKVNMKNDDGEKVIPVRTTRSRVGAETSVTHSPSPAEKNKRNEGKVNTKDNGGNKEISGRTRSRIAAVVPLNRSSPAVKNKVERGVGTKNIEGVEEVQVRTTRSRQGTETDFLPSASKKRTRGEMKVENTRTQKDVLATRSLRGKEIKGQDVNTEQNTPPRKRRKVIEDEREEEVKEVAALKKSTRQTPSKLRNDKNGRKGKGTLKVGKKAPQSKRFVEPLKKSTRAGGSNSKRKDLAINVNSVAPCDEKLQTDENSKNKNSKKTPAQKQGRKSIESDGKSSSTPEELPQRSTRRAQKHQSVNVDTDSSVHKVQGSDDVPSFVRENVDETVGIVKAVEESISMKEDGVPIGVPIVQGGLINSIDEATQMELEAKNVDDGRNEVINEEVVDDAPKEDFAQTLTYVGGIKEEASTYQNNNQLNAAAKETVDIAGEINNNATVSEDFPLEGASGTILMGISSGSKNVIESKNDLVTDHDVSLQDEAREELGTNQKTVDIVGAEVQTEMDGATYVDQTSTGRQVTESANLNIDVAGEINSPVNELKAQNEEASLSSRDSPSQSNSGALNVAEEINELDTSFEKNIDVAGAEDNLERDDTAIDETSTSQHITESPNQDINVAREINHPVMELNTENEEDLPTSEEVRMQSTGGTIDVAEESNELDIASNKAFEEAGADDHTKTDGNVITKAITEPDTATVVNIVAPGEISPPVLELEAQIDEGSTIPEESSIPSTSGTSPDIIRGKMGVDESEKDSVKDHILSLSNETKHMDQEAHVDGNVDTSTGEAIIEPDTDGSMLVAETSTGEAIIEPDTATAENIDAPGEINAPVLELETEIDETSPTPEASPIRSTSGTSPDSSGKMGVDESEKDSVHDHTLPLSSETRHTDQETHVDGNVDTSRDDRAKLEDFVCGLPKSEEVTVPTTAGNNTECIISAEKNVEDNEEVSVTVSHKNEFSENPVDVTCEIFDEDTSGSEQQNEMAKEDPVTMPTTVGTSPECIISVEMDVGDNEEVFVLSHMNEISETPVDARGEKSVEDTSASEQQNELSQEDPITMPTTVGTSRECYISGENDVSFIVSHANEISEIHVDITGERSVEDTSASEQQNELVQENLFTVPTNVDSSRECIISDENNVDDNEDVMVIVSHANESQTSSRECIISDENNVDDNEDVMVIVSHANESQTSSRECIISDENNVDDNEDVMVIVSHANESQTLLDVRSVEDTSASKQQDELTQADPVMDVGHLSTAESPKSRGPFNFDYVSAVDHDRETSSMMLHESPELLQGKPCGSDGLNTAALDKVGEGSVVKSCEISQETSVVESREEKHHSNLEKLDMEFVEDHVKEDATMIVQELPELPQSNADIGTEDTGKDTSMFQETTDTSLDESPADAELVEDYGEASVAKSDEASVAKSETMNYSFEFLIDQVSGGHPRESDTSDIKSFESRVFQEFSVEDVGKDLILNSQEVLEENIELSKEVNCGSDLDNPIVSPWDVNNEDLEASVEEFDLIPVDEECGSICSRKEEMNTNTSGVLDSSAMMDRDFDYGFGRVWGEENAVAPPVPRELGFRDPENEYGESAINAGDDKKPSEGASEMFVDFNEVADLHLNARPGAISPYYTQGNVNEPNFGSVDHFMPRDSWHMQDDFVDLKSYTNSETHSHVEYSQSHVEYSHVHQELVDPKISGANFVQGQGTESWKPVHAEHHGQTSRGSDYVKARESSPGSSHRR